MDVDEWGWYDGTFVKPLTFIPTGSEALDSTLGECVGYSSGKYSDQDCTQKHYYYCEYVQDRKPEILCSRTYRYD